MSRSNVVRLPNTSETSLQERIVKYAEVWLATSNKREAYEAAGYSCATGSNAYNFHKQHHEAITREASMHVASHVPKAIEALSDIMVNGKSETARVKAALEIMDRAGLDKTTRIQIGNDEPKNTEDMRKQLKELLQSNPELVLSDGGEDD
jgi:maleate cis-trans isomerase